MHKQVKTAGISKQLPELASCLVNEEEANSV